MGVLDFPPGGGNSCDQSYDRHNIDTIQTQYTGDSENVFFRSRHIKKRISGG